MKKVMYALAIVGFALIFATVNLLLSFGLAVYLIKSFAVVTLKVNTWIVGCTIIFGLCSINMYAVSGWLKRKLKLK